jgi:hypothetical protein
MTASLGRYVMFRTRPLKDRLERQVAKISWRLQVMDILGFVLNATGAVFAACGARLPPRR